MFIAQFFKEKTRKKQGLFKNIVFKSVELATKKLWAILDFFLHPDFFYALKSHKISL